MINGIASRVMDPIERKWVFKGKKPSEMRAAIILQNPEAHPQLIKSFVAPRVLRSTILNLAIIGVLLCIHIGIGNPSHLVWFLPVFLVSLFMITWGWYELDENYFVHLNATYKAIMRNSNEKASS